MTIDLIKTLLRTLHICMPIDNENSIYDYDVIDLFKHGVIVLDESGNLYTKPICPLLRDLILDAFGNSNDQWYNSFHKSWEKVANSPIEILIAEQLVHYFSTYGLESVGLSAHPYIPAEQLFVDLDEKPSIESFTVVRILPKEMCKTLATDYLLSLKSINNNVTPPSSIRSLLEFTEVDPEQLASFEVKCIAYDLLHKIPQEPTDWLRYVIYKTTGSTLVIKSKELINALKRVATLDRYFDGIKAEKLATIFYRFKPLFLAMKHANSNNETKHKINIIRRLAKQYHKPIGNALTVQNLSKFASENNWNAVDQTISKANNRQLIKCLNWISATLYTQQHVNNREEASAVYTIRNSKIYVDVNKSAKQRSYLYTLFEKLGNELVARFKNKFTGKTFMIPSYIDYAAPVSEKQMLDRYPFGTSITKPNTGFCTAICWNNIDSNISQHDYGRVDLDYHLNSISSNYGWNSSYRSSSRDILFSGDMTDARNGAAEVYKVSCNVTDPLLASVHRFNPGNEEVTFKFMLANTDKFKHSDERPGQAPIDVKDALFTPIEIKLEANALSTTLGVFNDDKFYFYSGTLSSGRVPTMYSKLMPKIAINKLCTSMPLKNILINGGATIINENDYNKMPDEEKQNVISLAPSDITASTLFELID